MSNQITPNPSVPSQIVAEVKFPRWINNLGIIPTSYKDSMSYYECLAWLCKFLEEQVIPTVNENGEAVEELQALYVELNSYVTNYFDNLDVQEKINNKLDDLVDDGTLDNILNNYRQVAKIYDTFSDLITDSPNIVNNMKVKTLGYYNKYDGGEAEYLISESEVENEINIPVGSFYAVLIVKNNTVNVKQIGAYGDGLEAHDDTEALDSSFTSRYNVFLPSGIYNFDEYLSSSADNRKIYSDGMATLFFTPGGRLDVEARPYSLLTISGDNVEIENITIDCNNNYIRRPHTLETEGYTEWLDYRTKSIKACSINNTENLKLKNCIFEEGIFKMKNSTNFVIDTCQVNNVCADSFYIADGCENGLIIHCSSENNGDDCFSINIDDHVSAPNNITIDSCYAKAIEGAMICCYGSHDINIKNCYGEDIRRCGGFRCSRAAQTGYDTFYPYNINLTDSFFTYANDIGGNDTNAGRGTESAFIASNPSSDFIANINIDNCKFIRNSGSLLYDYYFINVHGINIRNSEFKNINFRTYEDHTSNITFDNCKLSINTEFFVRISDKFKILNCEISNDCSQSVRDGNTDYRACILIHACYDCEFLNNKYKITNATNSRAIKIASATTVTGEKILFVCDTSSIVAYHVNYLYNILVKGVLNLNETAGMSIVNFYQGKLTMVRPFVIDTQVTPENTNRTYAQISLSGVVNAVPQCVIPLIIAPSNNSDATLKDIGIQSYSANSCIIRFTPTIANLTYTIRLFVFPQ